MPPFPIYTIIPVGTPGREIAAMAAARGQMVITDGKRILLAPKRLPGFSRVNTILLSVS